MYELKPRPESLILESYQLLQLSKIVAPPSITLRTRRAQERKKMELNPYDITQEDFICIVYYLEPYKIKVKIYRIDKPTGWTQDLNLCIENSEIIHIGSSIDNLWVKEYQIKTLVHPKSYSVTKIPKIIIQTGYWQKDNIQAWNTTQSFLDYNPDFLYLFYDNLDCISFFQTWCPDDLKYYLKLRPGAFRADFFRYAFLYQNGGCYFDHKMICRLPINEFIQGDKELVLCADWNYDVSLDTIENLYNAVIMVTPKHPLLENVLEKCRKNIQDSLYLDGAFSVTGPTLFKRCFDQVYPNNTAPIEFKHLAYLPWTNHKNMIVVHRTSNKVFLNKSYFVSNAKSGEYHQMYSDRTIYYPWVVILKDYLFYSMHVLIFDDSNFSIKNPNTEDTSVEIVDLIQQKIEIREIKSLEIIPLDVHKDK